MIACFQLTFLKASLLLMLLLSGQVELNAEPTSTQTNSTDPCSVCHRDHDASASCGICNNEVTDIGIFWGSVSCMVSTRNVLEFQILLIITSCPRKMYLGFAVNAGYQILAPLALFSISLTYQQKIASVFNQMTVKT